MNRYNEIKHTLDRFRKALNEAEEKDKKEDSGEWYNDKQGGIPYSPQDELLQSIMQTSKQQFGADFTNIKTPMFYYKEDGDVTFSGMIPGLNDSKFQFRLKDPSGIGCYFWSGEGSMMLSDENILTLTKILGVYKNWKKELVTCEDIRPTNYRNND